MQLEHQDSTAGGELARWLELARSRPCIACGSSPGGAGLERCAERYAGAPRLLAVGLGPDHDLAFVPIFMDGDRGVGCVALDELAIVRSSAFLHLDNADKEVVEAAGGKLRIAGLYNDPFVKRLIQSAAGVVAWNVTGLFPAVDASVLRETPPPSRTLAYPDAIRYGRWPAPWLAWRSLSAAIPWDEPPFRHCCGQPPTGSAMAALAAVGLPIVGPEAHPLVKALSVALLLRSVPWKGEREPLAARLLPVKSAMAVVAIYRGEVYRLGPHSKWEPLFAADPDAQEILAEDIELAEGHMRMVDAVSDPADDEREAGEAGQ